MSQPPVHQTAEEDFESVIDDEPTPDEAAELERQRQEEYGNGERQHTITHPSAPPPPGALIEEKVTTTFKTPPGARSPLTGQRWGGLGPPQTQRNIPQPGGDAAKSWVRSILTDPKKRAQHVRSCLRVRRLGPTRDNQGNKLETTDDLFEVALMEPEQLERQIREEFGGGLYQIGIYDEHGICQRVWDCKMSAQQYPPKQPAGSAPIDKSGNPVLMDDELRELEKDRKRFHWQAEKAEIVEAAEHRRLMREKELRDSKDDDKFAQMKREMDERERRWAEDQRRRDEQFQALMTQMNNTIQSIANRPQTDNGMKDVVAAMGTMTGQIMTAMLSKKDDGGETLKALMDSNRHVAEMAAANAKALAEAQTANTKEMITILTRQTDSSKQIKDYLELSDRAEDKAFRFVEMLQGRVEGDEGGGLTNEDGSINWGGAVKTVVGALKELRSGAEAGTVPPSVAGASDNQLADFARKLIPYLRGAAQSPAGPRPMLPPGPNQGGVMEVEDVRTEPRPDAPMTLAAADSEDSPASLRREAVTEVVRQWVRDAETAQIEPSWADMALATWGSFLDELAAHDITKPEGMQACMGLVRANCDEAVYARFQNLQMDMNNPSHARIRKAWLNGFAALMEAFAKRRNG